MSEAFPVLSSAPSGAGTLGARWPGLLAHFSARICFACRGLCCWTLCIVSVDVSACQRHGWVRSVERAPVRSCAVGTASPTSSCLLLGYPLELYFLGQDWSGRTSFVVFPFSLSPHWVLREGLVPCRVDVSCLITAQQGACQL